MYPEGDGFSCKVEDPPERRNKQAAPLAPTCKQTKQTRQTYNKYK